MSLSSLEHSNRLISDTRRRIDILRAELASEPLNDSSALRTRLLQQMELSLACLERNRDAIASRLPNGVARDQGV
jgi:hypothetical protein